MIVIAQTNGAFLIEASGDEIKEIVNAVTGTRPEKVVIGQKIPAIDYASTITKIKSLKDNSQYKTLLEYSERVKSTIDSLSAAVENASKIDL